jgi:hypothetical protein
MRPVAYANRHNFPEHVDELVPSKTVVVENFVVAVREPKIAATRLQKSAAGFLDVEGAPNPKVLQEYPKGQYGWGMALNGLWCSDRTMDAERNLNLYLCNADL